jgi:membrane protein
MPDTTTRTDPATEVGRRAAEPTDLPPAGWRDVLLRVKDEAKADNVVLLSAGVAFFGLLALVPALIALVSVYGLFADPAEIDRQVGDVLTAAPSEVRDVISQQLRSVTESSQGGLGLTLVISVAVALWSASSGMKHLITAVNAAYDESEGRGFVRVRAIALALTIGAIVFVMTSVFVITALPALLEDTAVGDAARVAVSIARWPLLAAGLVVGLGILYRYAPDRAGARFSWTAPGTIAATVIWLVASM